MRKRGVIGIIMGMCIVAMLAVGCGTLTGAVLGAVVVNYGKTYFTSGPLAPYWLFVLGGLFVGVTLLLPRGIIGTFQHWWEARRKPDTPGPDPRPVGAPALAE